MIPAMALLTFALLAQTSEIPQLLLRDLRRGDRVLIVVHGVLSTGENLEFVATNTIHAGSGHDRYILFEYRSEPDSLGGSILIEPGKHMAYPGSTDKAGLALARLAVEVETRTGEAADVYAHSQGTIVLMKSASVLYDEDLRRSGPWVEGLRRRLSYGTVALSGTPIRHSDKQVSLLARHAKAVYNFHGPQDPINFLLNGRFGRLDHADVRNIEVLGIGHTGWHGFHRFFARIYRDGRLSEEDEAELKARNDAERARQRDVLRRRVLGSGVPFPPSGPPPPPPPGGAAAVALEDGVRRCQVTVRARSGGRTDEVRLVVRKNVDEPLELLVAAGTVFSGAGGAYAQDLIVQ